jgi:hypothetical protein
MSELPRQKPPWAYNIHIKKMESRVKQVFSGEQVPMGRWRA